MAFLAQVSTQQVITKSISTLTLDVSSITGVVLGAVQPADITSTVQGLGTVGYVSSLLYASYSFFTVSSGTSYTNAPYGQQLVTMSNLSYQF